MKTDYKFINFKEIRENPKTKVWSCCNNTHDTELGIVKWYPAWRRYCYFPTIPAAYSSDCLEDINSFIKQAEELHKSSGSAESVLDHEEHEEREEKI